MDAREDDLDLEGGARRSEEVLENQSKRDNIWVVGGARVEECEWTGMERSKDNFNCLLVVKGVEVSRVNGK